MKSPKRKLLTVPFDLLVLEQETRVFRRRFEGKSLLPLSLSLHLLFLSSEFEFFQDSPFGTGVFLFEATGFELRNHRREETREKSEATGEGEVGECRKESDEIRG